MGKEISLFSRYSSGENRTTNYCLLMFRLLYEENPIFFSDLMEGLVGEEEVSNAVGVEFEQQGRYGDSVPDGIITQSSLTIFIEAKEGGSFSDSQLRRHADALDGQSGGVKLLLCLGKFETESRPQLDDIREYCRSDLDGRVSFVDASYEELLSSLELEGLPKNLQEIAEEFRDYLDQEDLLSSWQHRLDVVNCAKWPEGVIEDRIYMCPATGGAYSHKRSRYFGMYKDKAAQYVAEIQAVVDLRDDEDPQFKWKNRDVEDEALLERARSARARRRGADESATRVFLLGKLHDTDFQKRTEGGMIGSKQYFDISELDVQDAEELAEAVRGEPWSALG